MKTDLSTYNNNWFKPGHLLKRSLWYIVNVLFFENPFNPSSGLKVFLLRIFGAKLGKGVVIKPKVNIKYPWKLKIGNHCWIGEGVWIDNLDQITLEDHVCISQGALLLCGNHNYNVSSFDLMIAPIHIKEGSWVGARATVAPGSVFESHAVLSMGSLAKGQLEAYSVYSGNPAIKVKTRNIIS